MDALKNWQMHLKIGGCTYKLVDAFRISHSFYTDSPKLLSFFLAFLTMILLGVNWDLGSI